MSSTTDNDDRRHMAHAIRLARARTGGTYPNPCVGAVVVAGGDVAGTGRSAPTGGPHAEVRALEQAGAAARGADLYVTLEPCTHHGHTPPCVDAIIGAGIRRVILGVRDPAEPVAGKGVAALRSAGIEVVEHVLEEQCAAVHEHYLHSERTGAPFVTLKVALSIDGCIATASGHSQWITGEPARREAHRLRARHHAIAVGATTVRCDDPGLDVRMVSGVDPIPVIFDSGLSLATMEPMAKVVRPATLVLHTARASESARRALQDRGCELEQLEQTEAGSCDIRHALEVLGRRKIRSLLVEGGGRLHAAFVQARAWDRLVVFQAPRLLGDGRRFLPGLQWSRVDEAPALLVERRRTLGRDTMVVLRPENARARPKRVP